MSSFDSLKEPLGRGLDCARRIAELASVALSDLGPHGTWLEDIQKLHRDLPLFIEQAADSFNGDQRFADELQHKLVCVKDDVEKITEWVGPTWQELLKLLNATLMRDADGTTAVRFGEANSTDSSDCQRKRQAILESCNGVQVTANRICAHINRAAKIDAAMTGKIESLTQEKLAAIRDGDRHDVEIIRLAAEYWACCPRSKSTDLSRGCSRQEPCNPLGILPSSALHRQHVFDAGRSIQDFTESSEAIR